MREEGFRIYRDTGGVGVAFYLLGRDKGMVGVRDDSVYVLDRKYRESHLLGPLTGSRAEILTGGGLPVGVITFADGARYYGRELLRGDRAYEAIAAYNKLARYEAGPPGYVAGPGHVAAHVQQAATWTCRFCETSNASRETCAHCGARR